MRMLDYKNIFPYLADHQFEYSILENHTISLIKFIVKEFIKIKRFYLIKKFNTDKNDGLRQKLSRFLIFKHV
jgi:hypothetical protein